MKSFNCAGFSSDIELNYNGIASRASCMSIKNQVASLLVYKLELHSSLPSLPSTVIQLNSRGKISRCLLITHKKPSAEKETPLKPS